jgi:hypothetical protein
MPADACDQRGAARWHPAGWPCLSSCLRFMPPLCCPQSERMVLSRNFTGLASSSLLEGAADFRRTGLPVAPSPFPSEDEPNSCQRSMWGSDSGGRSRLGPMMPARGRAASSEKRLCDAQHRQIATRRRVSGQSSALRGNVPPKRRARGESAFPSWSSQVFS